MINFFGSGLGGLGSAMGGLQNQQQQLSNLNQGIYPITGSAAMHHFFKQNPITLVKSNNGTYIFYSIKNSDHKALLGIVYED